MSCHERRTARSPALPAKNIERNLVIYSVCILRANRPTTAGKARLGAFVAGTRMNHLNKTKYSISKKLKPGFVCNYLFTLETPTIL